MNTDEFRKQAFSLAVELGLEIYTFPPDGGPGCTLWICGRRGSADQYCKNFDNAEDAAIHWLTTREAQYALAKWEMEARGMMKRCEHVLKAAET